MRCPAFINLGRENWHSNKRCIREEPDRPHLSLTRELGLVVLLCYLFLPYILAVLRRIPLLEEGGELHRVITRLNSLHSTIQSPVAGEEISERPFYWVERCTLLSAFGFVLLCISTKWTCNLVSTSISKTMFLIWG